MITDDTTSRRRSLLLPALALGAPLLAGASGAMAQTNSALLVTPFPKEETHVSETTALFLESGHVAESGVDEDFQLGIYGSTGRFRLIPGELKSPRIGYDVTYLDLDTSFEGLPERLVDQSVAVGFPIAQIDDWIFGASLGVGYAGDGGYGDGDAWYGLASVAAFRQLDDKTGLAFVLDYDGNRTFLPDVPLPGFAYIKQVQDRLRMTVGVPVSSIEWTPSDRLTVELSYYIPEDVRVDIGYEIVDDIVIFGRARQQRDGFYFDGLPENHDRILFEQRRAEAGIRYEPWQGFNFDIALGYAWSTEFSEGFDSRESNEIADVSDEPYLRAGLELRF